MTAEAAQQKIDGDKNDKTVKKYGVLDGVVMMVGIIVGAGIFMSPASAASYVIYRGCTLLVWVFGGALAMLGAFSYVELGVLFPENGGEGLYLTKAYSRVLGAIYYWVSIFLSFPSATVSIAASATRCLIYIGLYLSGTQADPTKALWFKLVNVAANAGIVAGLAAMMIVSKRAEKIFGRITLTIKIISISCIILCGVIAAIMGNIQPMPRDLKPPTPVSGIGGSIEAYSYAALNCLWAYDGWNSINIIGGNISNPTKTFPAIIMISLPMITVLYLILNSIYLFVVPASLFKKQPRSVPMDFIAADVVSLVLSDAVGRTVLPLCIAGALMGSTAGNFLFGVSLTESCAEEGYFPAVFRPAKGKSVSVYSAVFQFVLVVVYAVIDQFCEADAVMSLMLMSLWVFYALSALSVVVFRGTMKNVPRAFKVPIYIPVIFVSIGMSMAAVGVVSMIMNGKASPFSQ